MVAVIIIILILLIAAGTGAYLYLDQQPSNDASTFDLNNISPPPTTVPPTTAPPTTAPSMTTLTTGPTIMASSTLPTTITATKPTATIAPTTTVTAPSPTKITTTVSATMPTVTGPTIMASSNLPIISNGIYRIKSKYRDGTCKSNPYLRWRWCSSRIKNQPHMANYDPALTAQKPSYEWKLRLVQGNDIYTIETNRAAQDGCFTYLGNKVGCTTSSVYTRGDAQKYRIVPVNGGYRIYNLASNSDANCKPYLSSRSCSSTVNAPLFNEDQTEENIWVLEQAR